MAGSAGASCKTVEPRGIRRFDGFVLLAVKETGAMKDLNPHFDTPN